MSTGGMMGLLEPRLTGFGFTRDEIEDLSYALGEILADLERIMPVLLSRQVPSRDDVLELISHAVHHWPGHQKEIAKLERLMPNSASGLLSKARKKQLGHHPLPDNFRREWAERRRDLRAKQASGSSLRRKRKSRSSSRSP
jgi:hypothetical protein